MVNQKFLLRILIGWFLIVVAAHYLSQRPLWNDEQCVFDSVEGYSVKRMFGDPLLRYQVFPRVYLFVIQQFSRVFDFHVLSLRFFSFAAMVAAFLIWVKISGYEMKRALERLLFIGSWAATGMLIYYGAELKPYSMDVFCGALFLLFIYNQEKLAKREGYKVILFLLPALGLFSYPAYVFAGIVFYNFVVSAVADPKQRRWAVLFGGSLAGFAALSYLFDMRLHAGQVISTGFGDYFISFKSVDVFFMTLWEGTNNLFSRWFAEHPKVIRKFVRFFVGFGFIYMFYGFFKNFKKDGYRFRSVDTIAFGLFAGLVVLGALKKYPFTVPRTSLFFCPFVLFLTARALCRLEGINRPLGKFVQGLYVVFLVVLSIGLAQAAFAGKLGGMPEVFGG